MPRRACFQQIYAFAGADEDHALHSKYTPAYLQARIDQLERHHQHSVLAS